MSVAARHVEDAAVSHIEATMAAHRAWAQNQEAIADHYEQLIAQAAAWRIRAMADADDAYRTEHGKATAQLVLGLPPVISRQLESGG